MVQEKIRYVQIPFREFFADPGRTDSLPVVFDGSNNLRFDTGLVAQVLQHVGVTSSLFAKSEIFADDDGGRIELSSEHLVDKCFGGLLGNLLGKFDDEHCVYLLLGEEATFLAARAEAKGGRLAVEKSNGMWFEGYTDTGPVQLGGASLCNLENLTMSAV